MKLIVKNDSIIIFVLRTKSMKKIIKNLVENGLFKI
jgi:hypothetical protein